MNQERYHLRNNEKGSCKEVHISFFFSIFYCLIVDARGMFHLKTVDKKLSVTACRVMVIRLTPHFGIEIFSKNFIWFKRNAKNFGHHTILLNCTFGVF